MATTGETVWASLIARKKVAENPDTEYRMCYLSFSFGRYVTYFTPRVPITEFKLCDYVFDSPIRVTPGIYIHFSLKVRGGTLGEDIKFKLVWPYLVRIVMEKSTTLFRYRFLYRENLILCVLAEYSNQMWSKVKKIFLTNQSRLSRGKRTILTPIRIFNLSLISGVLAPKASKLRKPYIRKKLGPWQRKPKIPRPSPEVITAQFKRANESSGVPYIEFTDNLECSRRTYSSINTPGFGGIKESALPINGHTVYLTKTDYEYGYDLRKKNIAPFNYTNNWGTQLYPMVSPLMTAADSQFAVVENSAIKKLNARANLGVQANMAQNLAQYTQTTNMIAKNAKNIAASVFALRKGKFSLAANLLFNNVGRSTGKQIRMGFPSKSKSLANNWLELQYGWKPLLSDIDESMRILASYIEKSSGTQQVKATATMTRQTVGKIFGPVSVDPAIGFERSQTLWSCRFGCKYKISSHLTSSLAQLGFTNPINLAWEILPWSFVVDWFLPIGPYLESLSAPHGLEFVVGYKTRFGRQITNSLVSFDGKMPGDSTANLRAYTNRTRTVVSLVRTRLSAWPVQSFPQFKNPFSEMHVANAIALLRQAFKTK